MSDQESNSTVNNSAKQDLTTETLVAALEAVMFVSGEPVDKDQLRQVLKCSVEELDVALEVLTERYSQKSSGVEIRNIAGMLQIRTKESYASFIQLLKSGRPRRLSPAALETLAIIAYRQPVVKSEIEKIRGVDVTPTLKTLLERDLIKVSGQLATAGQPSLYATTDEFLKIFGLDSLSSLPNLRELSEIEADPGEADLGEAGSDEEASDAPDETSAESVTQTEHSA